MSEEILKGLMQLFAIISKQDEGTTSHQHEFVKSFLSSQLNSDKVKEYLDLYEGKAGFNEDQAPARKLTSMKDSIRSVALCRKIGKTLTQKQKVVVFIRLFELLKADGLYTEQRMGIINTAAEVFNISDDEVELISHFSRDDQARSFDHQDVLLIRTPQEPELSRHIRYLDSEGLDGALRIIRVSSVDLYFLRYQGSHTISLNGRNINESSIYLLAPGSTIRLPQGTVYYSEVVNCFMADGTRNKLSFNASEITYTFPKGAVGLNKTDISEDFGLVGIMGASGSGKTTLLNVLSGIEKPDTGRVLINGVDIHREPESAEGLIGYISQDDLLMEDLTVYQNLYFNAKLCFRDLENEGIDELVDRMLHRLGLYERKDIKVGSPLNKKISGGQRKRLNIALELIREPAVLFVDEPTSGLSSRDSENVMDLLKELSQQGKLIFVVIHQPSSDIYKMFDRLILMDTGGYPIYYGNPIEAIMYFKQKAKQINADSGECILCGNVNPELLFNIIEAREVDDFGNYTSNRLRSPREWNRHYKEALMPVRKEDVKEAPERSFQIPGWFRQVGIFIKRDVLSKISNIQYLAINLLEAPILSLILVMIIKYKAGAGGTYVFRLNENLSPYIFMSIIVALFIGLSVSAEEIFRDRKIQKREAFLNLSRSGYLVSKILILFLVSAVQTLSFVLIGNSFLGIRGMFTEYWLMLLAVSFFANLLGLNISASFNSAVTIYILIPFLVIPQMALGGAMFSFDKLNSSIGGGKAHTPLVADIMTTRWAYEALSVSQFKDNPFQSCYYETDRLESIASYQQAYHIPELKSIVRESREILEGNRQLEGDRLVENLNLLRNEIAGEMLIIPGIAFPRLDELRPGSVSPDLLEKVEVYLEVLREAYVDLFNAVGLKKDQIKQSMAGEGRDPDLVYRSGMDRHQNDFLSDIVLKSRSEEKILREADRLIQVADPVYLFPEASCCSLRAHFFAPVKYLFGKRMNTYWFNLMLIIFFSLLLYVSLYFDLLRRLLERMAKK